MSAILHMKLLLEKWLSGVIDPTLHFAHLENYVLPWLSWLQFLLLLFYFGNIFPSLHFRFLFVVHFLSIFGIQILSETPLLLDNEIKLPKVLPP